MEKVVSKKELLMNCLASEIGAELDPAVDDCRLYKNNSPSFLSYLDKRTKEGCDRNCEVGIVHSGRSGEGTVPLRKPFSAIFCTVITRTVRTF